GRRMDDQTEGVGLEVAAAETVALESVLELLESVFDGSAPLDIPLVEIPTAARLCGDDISHVGPQGGDLDLHDDPALAAPGLLGAIADGRERSLGLAGAPEAILYGFDKGRSEEHT